MRMADEVLNCDMPTACNVIRALLKERSSRVWNVNRGKYHRYHCITIHSHLKRRSGVRPMTDEEREELSRLLGVPVSEDGVTIPDSLSERRRFIALAEGDLTARYSGNALKKSFELYIDNRVALRVFQRPNRVAVNGEQVYAYYTDRKPAELMAKALGHECREVSVQLADDTGFVVIGRGAKTKALRKFANPS